MKQVLIFIGVIFSIGIFSIVGYTDPTSVVGSMWKQIGTILSPADDVTEVGFGGTDLDYTTIDNWDTAVSVPHAVTGVDSHTAGPTSCQVTINDGDATLMDIAECHVHVQGPEYEFANLSGIDPSFGVGENSLFVGMTLHGYTTQISTWTPEQQRTIVPIARLNTPIGQTGPGSTISLLRDDRYFTSERDYKDRIWSQEAMGALYFKGGELFSYSTIVMGQYSGILYNAQKERHMLDEFTNMSAIFVSHTTGGAPVATKKRFVADNLLYDTGTGLAALTPNRWTKMDVLKSPQGSNGVQEGGWFVIYGDEYLTQAAAEAAPFNFSIFGSQGTSGLVSMAEIVVKQAGVTLGTDLFINDVRNCQVCRP